jgi:hypothetical protein
MAATENGGATASGEPKPAKTKHAGKPAKAKPAKGKRRASQRDIKAANA